MKKEFANAIKLLKINKINLRESKIKINDDVYIDDLNLDSLQGQSFKNTHRIRQLEVVHDDDTTAWNYKFEYALGIRLLPEISDLEELTHEEVEEHVQLEIVALFEADYYSLEQVSEEELKAFSVDNVGYHVWPYWREYVQSTCSRLGLNETINIPTYRVNGEY